MSDFLYDMIPTSQYKKSLKRIVKRNIYDTEELKTVIETLRRGRTLDLKYRDHSLKMDRRYYNGQPVRECHVQNDLLPVYRTAEDDKQLFLLDIGTHSDLFR